MTTGRGKTGEDFLVLVAGPEGTSFWGYRRIAKLLKLSEHEVLEATSGLLGKDHASGFREGLALPSNVLAIGSGGAKVSGEHEFIGWVMSWAPWAELVEPREWRSGVRERVRVLLSKHR